MDVQLKKGALEMCVLAKLNQNDSYAYEIAQHLADAVGMSEGTVYPLMRRLQQEELITSYLENSDSGPPRRYYHLTARGEAALRKQRAEWEIFSASVRKFLIDMD